MYDAVIIGGGASGLAAAIRARSRGKDVAVLEGAERVGRKILLAGNGRCNMSNERVERDCYNDGFVDRFLSRSRKVGEFFEEIGLKTRNIDGRIYPYTESGGTVLNLLRARLEEGVFCGEHVEEIRKEGELYVVNGRKARKAVIATGSAATAGTASYFLAEKFGHEVKEIHPALTPFVCRQSCLKRLAGIRAKGALRLFYGAEEVFCGRGEILFKDGGVSGIVSMDASRFADYRREGSIEVDFLPDMTEEEIRAFLGAHSVEGLVLRVVAREAELQAAERGMALSEVLKRFRLDGVRPDGLKRAQVARGGLSTDGFDDNLESVYTKGLYACGEVLDVDGACGGYNLHWAFLSGLIVGESI